MKQPIIVFQVTLILLIFSQCQMGPERREITLANNSTTELKDKPIAILRSAIPEIPDGIKYPLIISSAGDTIPSQLDDLDGDDIWDELFLVVNLPANRTHNFTLQWVDDEPYFLPRTSVRFGKRETIDQPVKPALQEILTAKELPKSLGFQKYQTDGPTWENDKVGFRHYLDGRNAKDFFGKLIPAISPETVGINAEGAVEDNYHVMEDWGRDILSVGNSVGIGGYGFITNNELFRLGVTVNDSVNNIAETRFRILTEGPVRSILNYHYSNWTPADRTYSVEETTSIWPGMYGYQNTVQCSGLQGDEDLGIGLVNIKTDKSLSQIDENDQYVVLYTHDQQTYEKEWWLGLALILPRDKYLGFIEAPKEGQLSNTFLARLNIENNEPVKYYAVACWELSDEGFRDEIYFINYLKDLTNQLSAEVQVTVR